MTPRSEAVISVVRVVSLGWRRAAWSQNGPAIRKDALCEVRVRFRVCDNVRARYVSPSRDGASLGQAEGLA